MVQVNKKNLNYRELSNFTLLHTPSQFEGKMASGALFGSTGRSQSKNLVEFRAGKMFMKGKMVHPDKRKGMVYVYQSDDALMHFCWKDRTNGTVEDVSIFDLSSYRISSVVYF